MVLFKRLCPLNWTRPRIFLLFLRVPIVLLFFPSSFSCFLRSCVPAFLRSCVPVVSPPAVPMRVVRPGAECCAALRSSSKAAKENP